MKNILALDGGGIRGVFSLQILARIESLLRQHHQRPDLVLSDVFDCFAGTSTGAIIAAGLCWGMTVADIEALYVQRGAEMFARSAWYRRFHSKYRAESIAAFFKNHFCEYDAQRSPSTFGTSRLRKMLIVVMRNASTGSPWPLSNHPSAKYNDRSRADCNLNFPLWQILRASTAAPTFFPPQEIFLNGKNQLFIDGAVTPYNNPALVAVMMTTLPGYGVQWPTGRKSLSLTSIGTGSVRTTMTRQTSATVNLLDQLGHAIPALINAVSVEQDILCRILGNCLHGDVIDREIGAIDCPSLLAPEALLFNYARYDLQLDHLQPMRLSRRQTEIDNLDMIPILQEIGTRYASEHVVLKDIIELTCN